MSDDLSPKPAGCRCEEQAGGAITLSPVCIGHLWLFQHLSPAEQEAISRSAARKKSGKGSPLFRQGDPADELFLIKGGRLKLSKVFEDGREVTLDIRKSGDFVGETLLSEAADYPVSAWCLEVTLTCGFDRRQCEQLVLAHPRIGLQIIRNMSERITSLTDRLGGLAGGPIEDRLLQTLVDPGSLVDPWLGRGMLCYSCRSFSRCRWRRLLIGVFRVKGLVARLLRDLLFPFCRDPG